MNFLKSMCVGLTCLGQVFFSFKLDVVGSGVFLDEPCWDRFTCSLGQFGSFVFPRTVTLIVGLR